MPRRRLLTAAATVGTDSGRGHAHRFLGRRVPEQGERRTHGNGEGGKTKKADFHDVDSRAAGGEPNCSLVRCRPTERSALTTIARGGETRAGESVRVVRVVRVGTLLRPIFPAADRPEAVVYHGRMTDAITLDYGGTDPLMLLPEPGADIVSCQGPAGVTGAAAETLVATAVGAPGHGPPLEAHVVAGDRVVVAVAGRLPQADAVVAAVRCRLVSAGIEDDDVSVLWGLPLEAAADTEAGGRGGIAGAVPFDPTAESATAFLATDEAGLPLSMARSLVDADVVIAVGAWGWHAGLGGRSLEGELWPTFSRPECRQQLVLALARRGRHALPDWRSSMQESIWQLGVCASLRLVAGRAGSLHTACFGLPDEAARLARHAAAAWCPTLVDSVDLAVVTLSRPRGDFATVGRAVAAAARVTHPGGTICVVSQVADGPGLIFERWRQGAPLQPLVHEAVASRDPALVVDALETRLFARALGERRLVLFSALDESAIEELSFGHAADPDVIDRLVHRAERVAVLHEADLMFPRIG